ncbi:dTDP-glucose 4,6-dehydratase [Paenibacillus sp. OV219]|uniref:dTDP-glucose 4,6-dehydratase n=1 Tax=Paenibacillus sp. OV219 TaxID=1884377 RepID=UPI0008D1CBAB|nr:dTDP-glucose 4,6-dehydratase [Paenibacillus sp. OV219]SEP03271.1 dTDP-glucose 4,6-dehydratase [Paenibacillus sp. OV219]
MNIIVTGGSGFIGSNFIHYMAQNHPEYAIINVDALTYAGNPHNLRKVENHPSYRFVQADIADRTALEPLFAAESVDAVINFAAESHVDRSIVQPDIFVRTNVLGTQTLLDLSKQYGVAKFVQVSTDEVYGTLGATGLFTELTPLAPNSPYSASKAGADMLVRAYYETYGMNANITRCSNNYGPYQFPEKLIPLMIQNTLEDKPLPVYGDGLNVRDWLYVEDHCRAIDLVLHRGAPGAIYNVGGTNERTNIEVVRRIVTELGRSESLITYVQDRLGHDRRYAIDASKIREELGWTPMYDYESGIKLTIEWYLNHTEWLDNVRTGAYRGGRS